MSVDIPVIAMVVTIRHWLPILTFCPVNGFPDFLYVQLEFQLNKDNPFVELYEVRKKVRSLLKGKKIFMEDAAVRIAAHYPEASKVTVSLWFNRHTVILERQ